MRTVAPDPASNRQLDVLAADAPEHVAEILEGLVDVDARRPGIVLASERQQLPRERRPPFGRFPDFLERGLVHRAVTAAVEQHVGVPHRDRQQIVEVVGHAGDELSDRLHLLRLAQPFLRGAQVEPGLVLRGHVFEHRQRAGRRTRLPADDRDGHAPPEQCAVPPPVTLFALVVGVTAGEELRDPPVLRRSISRLAQRAERQTRRSRPPRIRAAARAPD